MAPYSEKTIILKFGGAALSTVEQFDLVTSLILSKTENYPHIVVVVSAMGKMTDELIDLAKNAKEKRNGFSLTAPQQKALENKDKIDKLFNRMHPD